eukprot:CAMPEP_0171033758 /NCGR_PEP_ID=MMETSP0736-20130129/39252_1 /TAXON_ID=186038 /ORGANISM="Fragilariopsis kerguelensis, Strain L26-C5" /LENGTH=65 /DNA_ID=CAMNT_0011476913 /DNA_START=27 /DNA_END=221 /DNA_ORIENTATION=-
MTSVRTDSNIHIEYHTIIVHDKHVYVNNNSSLSSSFFDIEKISITERRRRNDDYRRMNTNLMSHE